MDVALRTLKAELSAFVKRAAAGEVVTVTDRGRPVAQLGPLPRSVAIDVGVEEGWITPASHRGLGSVTRVASDRATVLQSLAEDRDE